MNTDFDSDDTGSDPAKTYGGLDYTHEPPKRSTYQPPPRAIATLPKTNIAKTFIILIIALIGLFVIISGSFSIDDLLTKPNQNSAYDAVPFMLALGEILVGAGLLFRRELARIFLVWIMGISIVVTIIGFTLMSQLISNPSYIFLANIVVPSANILVVQVTVTILLDIGIIVLLNLKKVRQAFS